MNVHKLTDRLLLISLFLSMFQMAHADVTPVKFTITTAIQRALSQNLKLRAEKLKVEKADLALKELRYNSLFPKAELKGFTGLVPEAKGDVLNPETSDDSNRNWGPFIGLNLEIIQPLYSFGKYSAAHNAAVRHKKATEFRQMGARNNLILKVIRAYNGINAARQIRLLGDEIRQKYLDLLKEVNRRLKDETSGVDDFDRLKMETKAFDIEKLWIEGKNREKNAVLLFNILLNLPADTCVQILEDNWHELSIPGDCLPELRELALSMRPDIMALKSGIEALESKSNLARRGLYPDLFIAGGLEYGYAANRDEQNNPFVSDDYNYNRAFAVLGFRWNFDFHLRHIEVQKSGLAVSRLKRELRRLLSGIEFEIWQMYGSARKNYALKTAANSAFKSAKVWLRLASEHWDMGLTELDNVIDAHNAYYLLATKVTKTTFDYHASLAKLANSVGEPLLYLKWIENEKIYFN